MPRINGFNNLDLTRSVGYDIPQDHDASKSSHGLFETSLWSARELYKQHTSQDHDASKSSHGLFETSPWSARELYEQHTPQDHDASRFNHEHFEASLWSPNTEMLAPASLTRQIPHADIPQPVVLTNEQKRLRGWQTNLQGASPDERHNSDMGHKLRQWSDRGLLYLGTAIAITALGITAQELIDGKKQS